MLYVLSDTHLSFKTDKPMDVFGSRWKDHTAKIEYFWKRTLTENDSIVIGGDVSWGISLDEAKEDLLFLSSLPGQKILLRGNHDYWWSSLKKMTAFLEENGINNIKFIQNDSLVCEDFVLCGSRGWYNDTSNAPRECDHEKIVKREAMRLEMSLRHSLQFEGKERLAFLHFPPVFGDFIFRNVIDLLHSYDVKRCYYGHIHGVYNLPSEHIFEGITFHLCSSDFLDFRPKAILPQKN